jgi:hypothetical protein
VLVRAIVPAVEWALISYRWTLVYFNVAQLLREPIRVGVA